MKNIAPEHAAEPLPPLPENPLVSIITPSYNTGRFIEETLRSIEAQDYPYIEHIVLDSGSTDETPQILARHPSVRLIRPAPHPLVDKQNHGLSIAQGDILAILAADDCHLPGAVRKAVEALQAHPDVALVYGNDLQVDAHGAEVVRTRGWQTDVDGLLNRINIVPEPAAFFRRDALQRVGPLDARYPLVSDWNLWIRIARMYPILHVDDWWAAFRVHPGQLTAKNKYAAWKQGRRMTRELGGRFFSPLFWSYWRGKLTRGARMLRSGDVRMFARKLDGIVRGFATK